MIMRVNFRWETTEIRPNKNRLGNGQQNQYSNFLVILGFFCKSKWENSLENYRIDINAI